MCREASVLIGRVWCSWKADALFVCVSFVRGRACSPSSTHLAAILDPNTEDGLGALIRPAQDFAKRSGNKFLVGKSDFVDVVNNVLNLPNDDLASELYDAFKEANNTEVVRSCPFSCVLFAGCMSLCDRLLMITLRASEFSRPWAW